MRAKEVKNKWTLFSINIDMKYTFIFTKYAEKQFKKLDPSIQGRIIEKLKYFKKPQNIQNHIKIVYNLSPATHRIRIWEYRLLVEIEKAIVTIYKIAHRKEIYK